MTSNQNDDMIELTGLKTKSLWQFPLNLKTCPVNRCSAAFKTRSLAIKHYRANHASTSVLCVICKRPISVKNNPANYRTHFFSRHPNVKFSRSQHLKAAFANESTSQSTPNAVQPPKRSVKVLSNILQSNDQRKTCTICGMKIMKTNFGRHMIEMHSNKRILCPLKSCDFKSKRLDSIRAHWKTEHQNFRFPEIDQNSGFTYRTTDDTQENVSKRLL